jgi:hypothetical protein
MSSLRRAFVSVYEPREFGCRFRIGSDGIGEIDFRRRLDQCGDAMRCTRSWMDIGQLMSSLRYYEIPRDKLGCLHDRLPAFGLGCDQPGKVTQRNCIWLDRQLCHARLDLLGTQGRLDRRIEFFNNAASGRTLDPTTGPTVCLRLVRLRGDIRLCLLRKTVLLNVHACRASTSQHAANRPGPSAEVGNVAGRYRPELQRKDCFAFPV